MPTLNQKLLLRLVLAFAVFVGGLIVAHHVQAGRVPDAIFWQADAAIEKGKPDKAVFYLKQYLEFRPDDHDAAVKLADLLLDRAASAKDVQNAQFVYERVLRESPRRADVARKLVALCIRAHRYADALEHAQKLLETDKTDGVLRAQVAECLAAQDRPDEARAEYEQAITLAPSNVAAFEQYAALLERHFKKPQDAAAVLERMTQANPTRPDAFLARARFLQRDGKLDECMRSLDRVFLLDPENGEALVISAEVHQARGDLRKARETLRDAIAAYPRYVHGYRALSWLELVGGNEADALATLERGIAAMPDAPDLLTPLADLWIERGELERGREIVGRLDALQKAAPPDGRRTFALRAGYLRGRLAMKDGKWNEALAELEAVRTDAVGMSGLNAQVNVLVAACHEHRGEREAQIEALRRALSADATQLAARVALANALVNAGRTEDALKEYQSAAKSPSAGAGVEVAYLSLRLAWDRATGAPDDEWKALEGAIRRMRERQPTAVEPVVLLAEFSLARNDSAAEETLRTAASNCPGDVRLWIALADVVSRSRSTLAAVQVLAQASHLSGDSPLLHLARARLWVDDIQPGQSRRLAQLEESVGTEAERVSMLTGLADLYQLAGDDAGRARVLGGLAGLDPRDVSVRASLLSIALKQGDAGAAARWAGELKKLGAVGTRLGAVVEGLHRAQSLAAAPETVVAAWEESARGLLAVAPDRPEGHVLLGCVAERRRDLAAAARQFETAAGLDPTSVEPAAHCLALYFRSNQDEPVRRMLLRLESDPRLTPQRFRAIVERAMKAGVPDGLCRGLDLLAAHCRREPRSAVWAGRLLEAAGKPSEAMAAYRQLTELHPKFADGWSARLLAAARAGEAEVNETTRLAAKALDGPEFWTVCAECGAAVRARLPDWSPPIATPRDRRLYAEACIAACEARGRLGDAAPILKLVAEAADAPPDDAAWARRSLAVMTAALGDGDAKRQAILALRGEAVTASSAAEARSRLAALTAVLQTATGEDRRSVVEQMTALLSARTKDPSAMPGEWFELAQLHDLAGDRAAAAACRRELLKREPRNRFYAALVVEDLLDDGKLDDARPLVDQLGDAVEDVRVVAAAARYHAMTNQPAAALGLVDRYVRAVDPGTAESRARQRQGAELLDRLARGAIERKLSAGPVLVDAACERYRASLRSYPDVAAPMASVLAFAGRGPAAVAELERNKSQLPPATLALAGVGVVRVGPVGPKEVETVKGWVSSAVAANPSSIPLKLALGELLAGQGDFSAAEPVYRDVLKPDPKNLVALNNLAWILAARPEVASEALGLVDRAISLAGPNPEILDTRARILISAGQLERAIGELTAPNGPGGTLRLFHLALAYERAGKHADALRTFREAQARALDPRAIHPADLPAYRAFVAAANGPS